MINPLYDEECWACKPLACRFHLKNNNPRLTYWLQAAVPTFCSEHFPGLADIIDCLAADELLSMREPETTTAHARELIWYFA
jgi:hypothetical protein